MLMLVLLHAFPPVNPRTGPHKYRPDPAEYPGVGSSRGNCAFHAPIPLRVPGEGLWCRGVRRWRAAARVLGSVYEPPP